MQIIDVQSHVFPQEYAELLTRNRGCLQTIGGDGVYQINYWDVQRSGTREHLQLVPADLEHLSERTASLQSLSWEKASSKSSRRTQHST